MKRYRGRLTPGCLLCAAVLFAACAGSRSTHRAPGQVRVQVANIGRIPGSSQAPQAYIVLLKERAGSRQLKLLIGNEEGRAIALEMHGLAPPRPLTAFLLGNVIASTGNRVDRVAITALRDQVYYATIYLDKGRYAIDSRPSDAIALALDADAPIYVAADLLTPAPGAALSQAPSALPPEASGFGLTVQELTPGLASYFDAPASGGVLVTRVSTAAGGAGVHRGDIVETVGATPVRTLADYRRCIFRSRGAPAVTLTLQRLGVSHAISVRLPAPAADR